MIPIPVLCLTLLCLWPSLLEGISAQQPRVTYTKFASSRAQMNFFANSTSALYTDQWRNATVFVTNDEGRTWEEANVPTELRKEITLHPYDNQYAFIETRKGPNYKTSNQGMTWEPFDLPGSYSYISKSLVFHPELPGLVLVSRQRCVSSEDFGEDCHQEYYVTQDLFASKPALLLEKANSCLFARSLEEWSRDLPYTSQILASNDFFQTDKRVIDFGFRSNSYHPSGLSFVGKYAIVDLYSREGHGGATLISADLNHWERMSPDTMMNFHTAFALSENKLGTFESRFGSVGTLYVSDNSGTNLVETLKDVHNSAWFGGFAYDKVPGVEHTFITNIITNFSEYRSIPNEEFHTRISFDDGSEWRSIKPTLGDASNSAAPCDPRDEESCSLHFHPPKLTNEDFTFREYASTTSPAAGIVIRVGSIGPFLAPYEDCDTFISTDGGLNWGLLMNGPHRIEHSNHGSIIVLVRDEEDTDEVLYSTNSGQTWKTLKLEHRIQVQQVSASTAEASETFYLVGRLAHEDESSASNDVLVYSLDFSLLNREECSDGDFGKWYAKDNESNECINGHKEWYLRRRVGRDCAVGRRFQRSETKRIEGDCPCVDADYECDINHVKHENVCVPVVPESIPAGACHSNQGWYLGPSGYRLKAGNTCNKQRGVIKDAPVRKDCARPQLPEGEIGHTVFQFPKEVVQFEYLGESETILVRLRDGSVWQSRNDGYTWAQLYPEERFLMLITHEYSPHRAYLLTHSNNFFYTTDSGRSWYQMAAPAPSNTFGAPVLSFSSSADYLIWAGDVGCSGTQGATNCHMETYYSVDHGRRWKFVESYARHCEWARETGSKRHSSQIACEVYARKEGNQRHFSSVYNPVQLVSGANFYKEKNVLLQNIVGFHRSPDYDLVAKYQANTQWLSTLASKDGSKFSEALFPAGYHPDSRYLHILDTTPKSVFMYLETSESPNPPWGAILKSDAAGIAYVVSLDYVNENGRGRVDLARLPLLQGIILANIIANPDDSAITGRKELTTVISRSDGGSWRPLSPPVKDSRDRNYNCRATATSECSLHLHAFSERPNSRSSISVSSRPDLLISAGNVGVTLGPYEQSDTFLSRDAGLHWSEIHKGTHAWAFGDGGSILVMAKDSSATDRVIYSTDEGLTWYEYMLKGVEKIRVRSIVTNPEDASRRFVLFGYYPHSMDAHVAVQLDFTSLSNKPCVLNEENPEESDFEYYSLAGENDSCLFGQRAFYQRRVRDSQCYIGGATILNRRPTETCPCSESDFECEFNHARDSSGVCALEPGASTLPDNATCTPEEDKWYERTACRKISYSSCEGGLSLDRGVEHECASKSSWTLWNHGWLFWMTVLYLSLALGVLTAYAIFRCCGFARGKIRLSEDEATEMDSRSRTVKSFVAPPVFIGNLVARAFKRVARMLTSGLQKKRAGGRGEDEPLLSVGDD